MEELSFRVGNGCEGPLDLILTLISKHRLNILDINISDLLEQYLEQIRQWQEENLEVATEFLEMASRLVYIKTAGLLPNHSPQKEDPRARLVGELLEYQAVKEAAAFLGERDKGYAFFTRPQEKVEADPAYSRIHQPQELYQAYLDALGRGLNRPLPKAERFAPLVVRPVVSVESRMLHLLRRLYTSKRLTAEQLFEDSRSRSEVVATFLAVLELMKKNRLRMDGGTAVFQGGNRRKETAG